jgi:hypothetical protein
VTLVTTITLRDSVLSDGYGRQAARLAGPVPRHQLPFQPRISRGDRHSQPTFFSRRYNTTDAAIMTKMMPANPYCQSSPGMYAKFMP